MRSVVDVWVEKCRLGRKVSDTEDHSTIMPGTAGNVVE